MQKARIHSKYPGLSLALKYVCKLKAPARSSREAGIAGELNQALTGKESRRFPVPATDRFFKDPGTVQLPAIPLKGQTVSLAGKGDNLRKTPWRAGQTNSLQLLSEVAAPACRYPRGTV